MEFEAPSMSNSTALARSIIKQLIELGIKDVVLSPGSRNAPLSIALYEASERGLINLHVRIDERGAAFFALGIAKASARYVPVVCTSGTAVANYYPAVLEAHHSDINLLLLTADRPARLRRTGSNQTTDQSNIFGAEVFTGSPGKLVDLQSTIKGFDAICKGQYDHLPESAFYMVGTIEEAVAKAEKMAKEAAA